MPQKRLVSQLSRHTLFLALTVLILCGETAAAGEALRVLSLSVNDASAIGAPASAVTKQPVWRTTFGSERVSDDKGQTSGLGIEADVVLLQNVTNLKSLRRAFPPKYWRIIISKQMVLSDDPADPRSFEAISKSPATAVAVRFQKGVRVAGHLHLMELAARSSLAEAAKQSGALELSSAPLVAAIAVRLDLSGRTAWVVSAALDASCAIPGPVCPQRARLGAWIADRHKDGEAVISGGLLSEPEVTATECAVQTITVYPARVGALKTTNAATKRDGLGCAAYADAGG